MQPIRNSDRTPSTYTLDTLANQYQSVRLVRKEIKQIEVMDEEICLFLDHTHKCWPVVFWVISTAIAVLMMFGFIDN